MSKKTFGIIGGLGALAGADLFYKLVKCRPVMADQGKFHFLFEQHPFKDVAAILSRDAAMISRQLYVFEVSRAFAERKVDAILLPCFASHTFRETLQAELNVPLLDMMAALRQYVDRRVSAGETIGVLASDYVRHSALFERYFGDRYPLVYPSAANQQKLMGAIYGAHGLKAGNLDGPAIEHLHEVCLDVIDQGAKLILPGITELAMVCSAMQRRGIELVDSNQVYADFAASGEHGEIAPAFKLGIVGGVGPAATVDFMDKIVRNTPAGRDQDHIKMVVEQNPQIPDRTANLLHQAADPTVALFATCKRLETEGANAIAIPCNTAHAFVSAIQPSLNVPIINMLTETVNHIRDRYGADVTIGLLATSGTLHSRVYHDAAAAAGLALIAPSPDLQEKVMRAIYGPQGVKAGFTTGQCEDDLLDAAAHLAAAGAKVLILGCTELPLILPGITQLKLDRQEIGIVDPTEVLAKRCVALAQRSVAMA
ncbi:aspartate/glutamate racemase family protein [Andreprevotia chitinilytica]|uniref:aspartate/glutamate racemase family protein n=1 Tax=Andreprevotia chitinilytica TaxID=396808 RepID=UPI0005529472|nr:amino acid racemase [Andreprevotia chitinilytica]